MRGRHRLNSIFSCSEYSATNVEQEKGGENETGPYEVVEEWPAAVGEKGLHWGSQPGVFAEDGQRKSSSPRAES